jgi:hypothetical protein
LGDILAAERTAVEIENERPWVRALLVILRKKQEVLKIDFVRDLPANRMGLLRSRRGIGPA